MNLGPPIKPSPAPPAVEVWEKTATPGIERSSVTGYLRTVDIDTAAEDYLRALAKKSAP